MRQRGWIAAAFLWAAALACSSSNEPVAGPVLSPDGGNAGALADAGIAATDGSGTPTRGPGSATSEGSDGSVDTGASLTSGADGAVVVASDAGAVTAPDGSAAGGAIGGTCTACETCFKDNGCNVVDNDCNDDPACNPKENEWHACVCRSTNATQVAACDAAFSAVGSKAQSVIACAHQKCPICNNGAGQTCKASSTECRSCATTSCIGEIGTCTNDAACSAALDTMTKCACSAQMGQGTLAACLTPFQSAGGGAALTCLNAKCAAACGL